MHHLPRIFTPRKQRKRMDRPTFQPTSPSSSPSSSGPRLVRRNAVKNPEFTPSSSLPSSSSSSASTSISSSAQRTQSLDLYPSSDRSLRVEGNIDQLALVWRNLGLSGPEDFEIPKEAWKIYQQISDAAEHKSSQLVFDECEEEPTQLESLEVQLCIDDTSHDFRLTIQDTKVVESVSVIREVEQQHASEELEEHTYFRCSIDAAGAKGIKGDRPPPLTPPPYMPVPCLDSACSTWVLLKRLAPDDDEESQRIPLGPSFSSEDEDERDTCYLDEPVELMSRDTIYESVSSFIKSSHDDDSSSTTTDSASVISPNGGIDFTGWQKGRCLGRGSFGTVYVGFTSGAWLFAIKEVSLLEPGSEKCIISLQQEINMLSKLEHKNIVKYLGTDKDDKNLYIFLELMTMSLKDLYEKFTLKDSQVSVYTRQILLGLKYLHDRRIVHRDIKCANILVATDRTVKLADFGLAKAAKSNELKSSQGTCMWMAPEVVHSTTGYGTSVDIWSLGCTVLEMLTRQFPYYPLEPMQALLKIGRSEPPDVPKNLSKDSRDFILQCLQVNPSSRPSAAKLLHHPFTTKFLATELGSESPALGKWQYREPNAF